MNERIKMIRKAVGLTLVQFGEKIGVSAASISAIEIGKNNPSEQTIKSIVREFSVSEQWLRTGQGEMFPPRTRSEELAAYFGKVITEPDESYKKRLLLALSELTDEQWQVLIQLAQKMAGVE